ncbi:MAG: M23 family metallopeptidase [Desulfobacterales bacterium]
MHKHKRFTILVLHHKGTKVRQIVASGRLVTFVGFFLLFFLFFSGAVFLDYIRLKSSDIHNGNLEEIVTRQNENIEHQKSQIDLFAQRINEIKAELVTLNDFEKKIKIIANLEESDNQEEVFGVGGPLPEDLEAGNVISSGNNALLREMHVQMDQLETLTSHHQESLEQLFGLIRERQNLLAATPSIVPADGWISSRFGYRTSPFTGQKEFHKGLDVAARKGSDVKASADGVISFAGKKWALGKTVIIDHGYGMVTRYAHLDEINKKRGEAVKRGDIIGKVGDTGRSTGSHLHYEVLLNGIQVNPEKYILN